MRKRERGSRHRGRKGDNLLGKEGDAERKQLNTEGGAVDQHKRARESAAAVTGGARGITCWGRR